jgi:hydroxypyruvate reductase
LIRAALSALPATELPSAVVAAGKGAAPMFGAALPFLRDLRAVIATHSPDAVKGPGVRAFSAGHPSPNPDSAAAGEAALELAQESRGRGGLLVLLSGGASAMLVAPARGITLAEKVDTTTRLMHAGAAIHELNCVRKHLSRIKGGQLAAAAGRTIALALSDVHGPVADDPSVIGSGPTVPDDTTFADALGIVAGYGITLPGSVRAHLERGAIGQADETIKSGDSRLDESTFTLVGNRLMAVDGAARAAESAGYQVVVVRDPTTGEARDAARRFVEAAAEAARRATQPLCVIGSGETIVTVRGTGLGGRNQEFGLAGATGLSVIETGGRRAVLASAGTDGIDGPTDAAGVVVDAETISRGAAAGLDVQKALENNDAYHFAAAAGALITWGPTGTNVGDLHVLLVA